MKQVYCAIVDKIIVWGKEGVEDFRWRNPRSPYESAVAEIMLIRTPAEQAAPVYLDFLKRYPTVYDLDLATEGDIAEVIFPLGLSWRAKKLKAMADYLVNELKGQFPDTLGGLMEIPSIGPYTAAAIMTFYFRKRAVLVDANTVRFFKRFFGWKPPGEARRNRELISRMDQMTPDGQRAVLFNVSFLDFMRKVCRSRPGQPLCDECLLEADCQHAQTEEDN
ncbi:MAG: hypothetical protein JRI36_13825 [Deltaproteobacteria bacterium]|nr:hypothetical protein [Deltaproteobacteria bacterium]